MIRLYYNPAGVVLQKMQSRPGVDEEIDGMQSMLVDDVPEGAIYIKAGKLCCGGNSPSMHHRFDYKAEKWIDPRTDADMMNQVRADRASRMAATDWTQLPDVPEATKAKYKKYRQTLRDITKQKDPRNIAWPVLPA